MSSADSGPAVSAPVGLLLVANAVLFALGAMLHGGAELGAVSEPASVPAMALEVASTLLLALATIGLFTPAEWARRVARFANTFAIVTVVAVSMLLGLDGERSSASMKAMQVLRVVFATVSLLMLYHQAQRRTSY